LSIEYPDAAFSTLVCAFHDWAPVEQLMGKVTQTDLQPWTLAPWRGQTLICVAAHALLFAAAL